VNWDVFVAIGTLLLALVTYMLARDTHRLARASEADLRARWRPVMLPTLDRPTGPALDHDAHRTLRVGVRNAGGGPALYIRAHLEPGGHSPQHWSLGALAPADEVVLTFPDVDKSTTPLQLLLDYRDVGGRTHSTAITLVTLDGALRFYDVRLFEDHHVTVVGDAVYPQDGLRDVSPQTPPGRRGRLRAAVGVLRGTADSASIRSGGRPKV
jgi:hypothetical protein